MKCAGTAKVAIIAEHWHVSDATARNILNAAGLVPVNTGPIKYSWSDIWLLEGEVHVPPDLWKPYKAKLLKVPDLPVEDDEKRSERAWRRYVEKKRLPVIRLSDTITRVRRCVFEIAQHYV